MNSMLNDYFTNALGSESNGKNTLINLSCHQHFHPVKKIYFDKSTNHQKELDFLEKTNIFVLEVVLPLSYPQESKIKYEIYSDKNNSSQQKILGSVENNSSSKKIVIIADTEDDEYFVSIKIMSPDVSNVLEVCHQFVSKNRAEKSLIDMQKNNDANSKYLDENTENLEEIVEYANDNDLNVAESVLQKLKDRVDNA